MNNYTELEMTKDRLKKGLVHDLPVLRARLGVSQEELLRKSVYQDKHTMLLKPEKKI